MAEQANLFTFTYKEIVECLVKKQGIHEGLWGIFISFQLGATNVLNTTDSESYMPAAIVPIQNIGIQRFAEPSNLTVDAAVVNPAPKIKLKKQRIRKNK